MSESRADYLRIYRQARREANANGLIVLEMGPGILRYAEDNGQDSSESEERESTTDTEPEELEEPEESSASENEMDNSCNAIDIVKWVYTCNVPMNTLQPLIRILRKTNEFHDLPDARTILKQPRQIELISKCGGDYIYLGVESGIFRLITIFPESFTNCEITFDLNIDGLPLFSSSNGQLWPTLCHVMNFQPFVVSLFYGHSKPDDVNELLNDLLLELKELENKDIIVNDDTFKLKFRAFICDAPARQMIKCITSHRGYFSCERCKTRGRNFSRPERPGRRGRPGSVYFPLRAGRLPSLRTDDEFNRFGYVRHQKAVSPIVTHGLNISCIKNFVLDVMHLVFLGVVKKMLQFYTKQPYPAKLTMAQINLLARNFAKNEHLPHEFARQPRTLRYVDRFKATEYRTFILYTGPVIMRGILSPRQYKHFLYLHIAMSVLCDENDEFRNERLDFAHQNLVCFVKHARHIFGIKFMTYNTHGLIHLVDDVRHFGCSLNNISAFPFENHLGKLKRNISQGKNPLAQLVKKVKGLERTCLDQRLNKKELKIGEHQKGEEADCFFLLRNHVAMVLTQKRMDVYKCRLFKKEDLNDFFTSPSHSKDIDIYHMRDRRPLSSVQYVHVSELETKLVPVPYINGTVLFKLRHTGYI